MRFLHRQDEAGKFYKWKVFRSCVSRETLYSHRIIYGFKCLYIINALLRIEINEFVIRSSSVETY